MKVFLSWSGETSREVACALRDWLPYVIQSVKPFVSSGDIDKGRRWSDVIAAELNTASYGIICLTPYNVTAPWIHFESGAISKALDASSVSPFLFRVPVDRMPGPLQQFQSTVFRKDDVLSLLISINNRQEPDARVPAEVLRAEFDVWWPTLEKRLARIENVWKETETGFEWLLSRSDLCRIQSEASVKQIWVITPELYRHALAPESKDVFQRNIDRGVEYTFITDDQKMDLAAQVLKQLANAKGEQVCIRDLPEEEFRRLAATDYIIINPLPDGKDLRVFLEIPITQRGYWIPVEAQAAMAFVSRFRAPANRPDTPALRAVSSGS